MTRDQTSTTGPSHALPTTPAVHARGLVIRTRREPVCGPVDLDVERGGFVVVTGPRGSGRSSLLLTLTGRMRASEGELTVLGVPVTRNLRRLQRRTAVANMRDIDELDDAMRLSELLYERLALVTPFWRRPPAWTSDAVTRWRELCFGGCDVRPDARVRDLTALETLQYRVFLAVVDEPEVLAVDDIDHLGAPDDQRAAFACLRAVANEGVTVVCATTNTETVPDDCATVALAATTAASDLDEIRDNLADLEQGPDDRADGGTAGDTGARGTTNDAADAADDDAGTDATRVSTTTGTTTDDAQQED
ncbi:ATP-binding cassette domain-containing protein [Corynebacterium bovis]|uniref:ATP-binding cassette domain-containing protein n=1 Tax=Corynebacterium bovis TaxID=36808 RepID=UPI003139DF74